MSWGPGFTVPPPKTRVPQDASGICMPCMHMHHFECIYALACPHLHMFHCVCLQACILIRAWHACISIYIWPYLF